MASVVCAIRGNQIHILDEIQGHPDTETLAKQIVAKYKDKGHRVTVYPDPAGQARKTSAAVGRTDFSILKDHGLITKSRSKAPPIIDSVAAVNRKFKNAAGQIDMLVHPRCVNTIKSIERTLWTENNPDTATIDKREGVEHWSDALRYMVEFLYPIKSGSIAAVKGFQF